MTTKAGTVTLVIGSAIVERGTPTEVQPVHFRDPVYLDDSIATEEESFVRVLLGRKALVTVSEMSVLTITEDLHQASINLDSGFIGLSVARKRMDNGEFIEIRTPHAVAAVRGTKVIAEVPKPDITRITVVEGHVDVYSRSRPDRILSVRTNQSVEARLKAPSRIKNLAPKALEQKKQKLIPPKEPVENSLALDRIVKKQIGEASQIARILTSEEMHENLGASQGKVLEADISDSEGSEGTSMGDSSDSGKTGGAPAESTSTASLSNTSQATAPTKGSAESSKGKTSQSKSTVSNSKGSSSNTKTQKASNNKSNGGSKSKGTAAKSKGGSKPKVKKASNKSKGGSKPKVKKASKPKMKKASKPKMKKASKPRIKKVSKPKSFAKKSKKRRKRKK